jgi:hypothetical protein
MNIFHTALTGLTLISCAAHLDADEGHIPYLFEKEGSSYRLTLPQSSASYYGFQHSANLQDAYCYC